MTLQCERCGGTLEVLAQNLLVKCPFCGVALIYEKEPFIGRFVMKRLIQYPVATRIFETRLGEAFLKDVPENKEPELFYFPFWRITTRTGEEEEVRFTPGTNPETELFTQAKLPEGELVEFHSGSSYDAPIREATVNADSALTRLSSQGGGFDSIKELALVYAPFYLMQIRARDGRLHFLLLEASSGKLYDDLPAKKNLNLLSESGLAYLLAFLIFLIEGKFIPSPVGKLVAFCLTMIPTHLALSYLREMQEE